MNWQSIYVLCSFMKDLIQCYISCSLVIIKYFIEFCVSKPMSVRSCLIQTNSLMIDVMAQYSASIWSRDDTLFLIFPNDQIFTYKYAKISCSFSIKASDSIFIRITIYFIRIIILHPNFLFGCTFQISQYPIYDI
jgi:hypothetical protein